MSFQEFFLEGALIRFDDLLNLRKSVPYSIKLTNFHTPDIFHVTDAA